MWCTLGVPFTAEASSVDYVVALHQTVGTRRRAEADRPHREVRVPRRSLIMLVADSVLAAGTVLHLSVLKPFIFC